MSKRKKGRKGGVSFKGVGTEVYKEEMEKRREQASANISFKPAVFPVITREEAAASTPHREKPSLEPKRKRGRPPVAVKKKQYTLTLHPDMYERAVEESAKRGISFSALVALALTEYLK